MIPVLLLAFAQAPAVLHVRLWLPEGTPDRGIPLTIVGESRDRRVEITGISDGHRAAFFHIEETVARATDSWRPWVGESEEPEAPCSELVVHLLGARRPEVDGWRVRLRSLDHRVVIVKNWVPGRERVHQAGMSQGRWTAELLGPDGVVESTASGVARGSRTLTLILR